MPADSISTEELRALLVAGRPVTVIDIRTPADRDWSIPGSLMVLADRGSVGRALFEQIDEVPVQNSPAGTVEPRRPHAIAGMAGS